MTDIKELEFLFDIYKHLRNSYLNFLQEKLDRSFSHPVHDSVSNAVNNIRKGISDIITDYQPEQMDLIEQNSEMCRDGMIRGLIYTWRHERGIQ